MSSRDHLDDVPPLDGAAASEKSRPAHRAKALAKLREPLNKNAPISVPESAAPDPTERRRRLRPFVIALADMLAAQLTGEE